MALPSICIAVFRGERTHSKCVRERITAAVRRALRRALVRAARPRAPAEALGDAGAFFVCAAATEHAERVALRACVCTLREGGVVGLLVGRQDLFAAFRASAAVACGLVVDLGMIAAVGGCGPARAAAVAVPSNGDLRAIWRGSTATKCDHERSERAECKEGERLLHERGLALHRGPIRARPMCDRAPCGCDQGAPPAVERRSAEAKLVRRKR